MPTKKDRIAALEKEVETLKKQWESLSKVFTIVELPKAAPRDFSTSGYSG